jgi:Tfp pilus assembly protein PilX
MRTFPYSNHRSSKGAALMIVLAFVVLLTGLALAYFSRAGTDRQLAQSSHNDISADVLAHSALDIVVSDFKQELLSPAANPVTGPNIQAQRCGVPADPTLIPNLIRRSVRDDGPGGANAMPAPGVPSGASAVTSAPADPANPRRGEITSGRWNSHYLIPVGSTSFTAPDWVLVTGQGPNSAPAPSAVIGRYAFAVYDEGGLLDMTLAGFPTWTGSSSGGPNPTPTPWTVNVGRKGIVAFADLAALPTAPTSAQISKIAGWRNYGTTKQAATDFGFTFPLNPNGRQDAWGSYLLDFGDAPYTDPSIYPFTSVPSDFTSNSRTDQAFITRQELLKLQRSIGFSQDALQYMGTFSRERNRPAPDWYRLNGRLSDRFPMNAFGLVKPNPPGSVTQRGRGNGNGNGGGWRGRGRYRGSARDILDMFGLGWVPGNPDVTDKTQLAYWGHWLYVGEQGPSDPPNPNPLPHIPPLRGRLEFIRILNYLLNQANPDWDPFGNDTGLDRIKRTLSITASLIDQYDDSADTDEPDPRTGSHTTIIEYSGGFVLGWETENNPSSSGYDVNKDPYAWINAPDTKPRPASAPIVLNHAFSNVGEFGYGLDTEHGFQSLNFTTEASNDKPILDFITYNPILHQYPRAGIVNLNTKNDRVLAAILKSALKNDTIASPPASVISQDEATAAASAVVAETTARPVLNRGDVTRLVRVAAPSSWTKEQKESIARALAELGQARTWDLMIDLIAQTGRYAPDATDVSQANKFIVEGEKRYWLHIALGRDLITNPDGTQSVDVLGTQLEEVVE